VRRLCHHQSNYILSGENYWASPRASISYDGKFVMFTSNWGEPGRTDVFILKIPAAPVAEDSTSYINNLKPEEITVFPNPATDHLQLRIPDHFEIYSTKTYNYLGSEVHIIFDEANGAFIKWLPAGFYYTEIIFENKKIVKKWVKE